MNNKIFKIFILFVSIISITLNVQALDLNDYITEDTNNQTEEITQNESEQQEQTEENNALEVATDYFSVHETKNGNQIIIEDDAGLLTGEEIEKLKQKILPLTEYGHIAFKSINYNTSSSTRAYAENYYYQHFQNESGTLFIIDMDYRYIYIVSAGANYQYITKGKAEIITDNAYTDASLEHYYDCAYKVFDQIETILEGGKILEPMRYISNIIVSIVVAFFINFFIVLTLSRVSKAGNNEILKNCNIDFVVNSISGTKTGTHRVYSPPSESSGGSSGGGGGGGGGGFSGGGGGHSF